MSRTYRFKPSSKKQEKRKEPYRREHYDFKVEDDDLDINIRIHV